MLRIRPARELCRDLVDMHPLFYIISTRHIPRFSPPHACILHQNCFTDDFYTAELRQIIDALHDTAHYCTEYFSAYANGRQWPPMSQPTGAHLCRKVPKTEFKRFLPQAERRALSHGLQLTSCSLQSLAMQCRSGANESARLGRPASKLRSFGAGSYQQLYPSFWPFLFCQPARAHPTSFKILTLTLCSSITAAAGAHSALREHTAAPISSRGLTPHQRPMESPPSVPLPISLNSGENQ